MLDDIVETICTYEHRSKDLIIPQGYQRFCLRNDHSLLDGKRHDIDPNMLARACSQISPTVSKAKELQDFGTPKLIENGHMLRWTIPFKRKSKKLPFMSSGHLKVVFDRDEQKYYVHMFWNETISIETAIRTIAYGFDHQSQVLDFLSRARDWGRASWAKQKKEIEERQRDREFADEMIRKMIVTTLP